jgi:hypothetical protein
VQNKTRIGMLIVLAIVGLAAGIALAGSVYGRDTKTLSTTAGAGTWTNSSTYAAIVLKRIWIHGSLAATNIVTINRVTSSGTYTQSVGTIDVAANVGSTASFTAAYLKDGDMLAFSSSIATGATAMIEYEFQQH